LTTHDVQRILRLNIFGASQMSECIIKGPKQESMTFSDGIDFYKLDTKTPSIPQTVLAEPVLVSYPQFYFFSNGTFWLSGTSLYI